MLWAPYLVGDVVCMPQSLLVVVAVGGQQVLWAVVVMGDHVGMGIADDGCGWGRRLFGC